MADPRSLSRPARLLLSGCGAALILFVAGWFAADQRNSARGADAATKPKFDPVQANGEIFVDWPTPKAAIVFSGKMDGYIEPCGCAGLENQKGGLKRRYALIKQLEARGWPLVLLDAGGLVKRIGPQSEVKYYHILDGLAKMGYDAVGLGEGDLKLSAEALAYAFSNVEPDGNLVITANVGLFAADSGGMAQPFRVIESGGKVVGVTTVLGVRQVTALKQNGDLVLSNPAAALQKIAPQLAEKKCDLQILLVDGDLGEAADLSQKFPQFQVVMATGGAEEPPSRPTTIPGSAAALVETGAKGEYVVVLGIYDDPDPVNRFRYQRVPLDSRFEDAPEMQKVLVDYQTELKGKGINELVGAAPNPHMDGDFAGSATCMDCHTKAAAVWQNTPHAHATDTLVHLDPPRHFDPECLSCHVTGWNPEEYFPYASGYLGLDSTPDLVGNGCENCHGPGKAHADAESGITSMTPEEQETLRAALRLKIVANEGNIDEKHQALGKVVDTCLKCHDDDNSPDFDFQAYWPKVQHVGKN